MLEAEPERVARVRENAAFLVEELARLGVKAATQSAIVPILVGDERWAVRMAESLRAEGFLVPAIRYPTVARGAARLRVAVMSAHTRADLSLAAAVSGGRSFVTLATVVPEAADDVSHATALRDSIRRHLNKVRLEAQIRIYPSGDTWSGLRELVRAYGFGPLTPNTVLIGTPARAEDNRPFGGLLHTLARCQRNIVLLSEGQRQSLSQVTRHDFSAPAGQRIDIWWRGQTDNGAFMLALACLVLRADAWHSATLRICNIAESGVDVEEARRVLAEFVEKARVTAEVLVLEPDSGKPFNERICEVSGDADLTFVGMRGPGHEENPESYADYVQSLTSGLSSLPLAVFALAGEAVEFRRIFRE